MKRIYGKDFPTPGSAATDATHDGQYMATYRPFLNEVITRPQVVAQADQIITRSGKDVQIFYAGCEYGNARGFDSGFGKGIVAGVICTLAFLSLVKK